MEGKVGPDAQGSLLVVAGVAKGLMAVGSRVEGGGSG